MDIKTFYVDFNDQDKKFGFKGVALTATPANKAFFVAMKEIKLYLNDDLQMLYGPLLIPEQRILRHTKELGHFNIVFSKEVIAKLARNLHLQAVPFNYEHDPKKKVNGTIQEVWLTSTPDKSNAFGYDLPEGTLFGGLHIQDKDFWLSEVKTGNVKGFSIEANMELLLTELKNINMTKIQLTEVADVDGRLLKTSAETIEVGTVMYTEVDGENKPLEAGEYTLSNGMVLVIDEASTVVEIKEPTAEEMAAQELKTEMSAMFAPFLKPLLDKIATLEAKLSAVEVKVENTPAPAAPKKKETPVKMSGHDMVAEWVKRKKALTSK